MIAESSPEWRGVARKIGFEQVCGLHGLAPQPFISTGETAKAHRQKPLAHKVFRLDSIQLQRLQTPEGNVKTPHDLESSSATPKRWIER